jgi:hypothetical protein
MCLTIPDRCQEGRSEVSPIIQTSHRRSGSQTAWSRTYAVSTEVARPARSEWRPYLAASSPARSRSRRTMRATLSQGAGQAPAGHGGDGAQQRAKLMPLAVSQFRRA